MSGLVSHCAGLAAEDSVAAHYARIGARVVERRWRGAAGEIDLILSYAGGLIFAEVKKSRSFAAAAAHLSPRQRQRLELAAQEYLAGAPAGLDTPCRFDAVLVDAMGRVEVIENAFM